MAMSYTLEEYVKKKRGSAPAAKEYAESFHCYRCHADPGEECVCSFHLLYPYDEEYWGCADVIPHDERLKIGLRWWEKLWIYLRERLYPVYEDRYSFPHWYNYLRCRITEMGYKNDFIRQKCFGCKRATPHEWLGTINSFRGPFEWGECLYRCTFCRSESLHVWGEIEMENRKKDLLYLEEDFLVDCGPKGSR